MFTENPRVGGSSEARSADRRTQCARRASEASPLTANRLTPVLALAALGSLRAPDSLRESVRPWPPIFIMVPFYVPFSFGSGIR